ncbi:MULTISPECIES: hypothetical protein [unclassified Mesorhizobium]|uniref:hypothetical protein n=1 Tax=unclassified Mesorhizobium TaxID=325217 RepID=UPI003339C8C7
MPKFTNAVTGSENAIEGVSVDGEGVVGTSTDGVGVLGESKRNEGVRGVSRGSHPGVVGINNSADLRLGPVSLHHEASSGGNGGWFESSLGEGVRGWSKNLNHGGVVGVNSAGGNAIYGTSSDGAAIWGTSQNNEGVHAETHSPGMAALAAFQLNPESTGAALYAKHEGNLTAALFVGNVVVTGNIDVTGPGSDIRLLNEDCAEDFDVRDAQQVEPGTVMILGQDGALEESNCAYDKRVAGVISGAGDFKPGIVLGSRPQSINRQPIALMGKVYCKADAHFGQIEVGDLLTTSPTAGHAMTASDRDRAFGTIIGKALGPLQSGRGLIPILVALQ